MAATLVYALDNIACTDTVCKWTKKASDTVVVRTVEEVYPAVKNNFKALDRDVSDKNTDMLRESFNAMPTNNLHF